MLFTTFLSRPNPRASLPIIHFVRAYSVPADPPVPKKKVWDSIDSAVKEVKSGDVLLSGGAVRR
jgi:3-oxoacid CoA-transferase